MDLVDFIPFGRENAISRQQLAMSAGLDDREVRDTVKRYRAKWTAIEPMICSDSEIKGYWLSCDRNEIERCRDFLKSYCNSTGRVVGNIDKQLAALDGTGRVWVRGHWRRVKG